jgi:hypothetical protein
MDTRRQTEFLRRYLADLQHRLEAGADDSGARSELDKTRRLLDKLELKAAGRGGVS